VSTIMAQSNGGVYVTEEVAKRVRDAIGVGSAASIWRWVAAGKFPPPLPYGRGLWAKAVVEAWLSDVLAGRSGQFAMVG